MKNLKYLALVLAVGVGLAIFPSHILAATPTLSVTSFNNNSVQITVNGDANSGISLYYYPPNSSSLISVGSIGATNSSGYFSTIINSGTYNIPSGSNTYVTVNGQQSPSISWPYNNNNNGGGGSISFSQNNISLNYGQSTNVAIYGGSGSYYVSSNSNSNSVNATISGNQLYLSAPSQYQGGSATITVCSNGSNTTCGSIYVTVQNNGGYNNQSISFSQNNLSLNIGQNQTVTISGPGNYYLSYSSNSNIVSATINGNSLNVYGNSQGLTNLTVCTYSNSNNGCGTLYVTVNNNYYNPGYYNNNPPVVYMQNQNPISYQSPYGAPSAGVFLDQVPSTGIDMNLKVFLFFLGLFAWSAFTAHMILTHKKHKEHYSSLEHFS